MQNRKILTLEEVLKLNRRPTLQELVDLSIKDYTKYLYHKGVIKYIPECGTVWNYVEDELNEWGNNKNYDPNNDAILTLKNDVVDEYESLDEDSELYESLSVIEEGVVYIDGNIEGNVEGNRKIEYYMNEKAIYIIHEKYGKYWIPTEQIKHLLKVN